MSLEFYIYICTLPRALRVFMIRAYIPVKPLAAMLKYINVTLSHLRSHAQAVVLYITDVLPLWFAKIFKPFQQEFTINSNNRISFQQLWNVIIIVVIILYPGAPGFL